MLPGSNCADAPIRRNGQDGWLLEQLGRGFTLLSFGPAQPVSVGGIGASVLEVGKDIEDRDGLLAQRYDGQPGTVYLIRPDQYVARAGASSTPSWCAPRWPAPQTAMNPKASTAMALNHQPNIPSRTSSMPS